MGWVVGMGFVLITGQKLLEETKSEGRAVVNE
jgi:hypothetical protein